jgi:hypothetical protein
MTEILVLLALAALAALPGVLALLGLRELEDRLAVLEAQVLQAALVLKDHQETLARATADPIVPVIPERETIRGKGTAKAVRKGRTSK